MVIHISDEGVHDPYQVTDFILLIFVGQMVYPFLDVGVEYFLVELSFGEGDGNIHDALQLLDDVEVEFIELYSFIEIGDVLFFEYVLIDESVLVLPFVGHF